MASYLDKFKLTTALDTNTTMDLSCTHITTSDWMHCAPTYMKEMVPGESIKIHQETFTRLAPMSVPTFGRGLIHNRAFFVPFRTVFSKWNEFITAADVATSVQGLGSGDSTSVSVNRVPIVSNESLVRLFCFQASGFTTAGTTSFATLQTAAGTQPEDCDIVLLVTSGASDAAVSELYYNLTAKGRRLMKVLQSLGYSMLWKVNKDQETDVEEYSALPLMSYLKVILDWYYPSQYVGDSTYRFVESILNNQPSSTGVYQLGTLDLWKIFADDDSPFNGLVNYDSDYFVSAFDKPFGSSQGTSIVSVPDISVEGGYYSHSVVTTNNLGSGNNVITSNGTPQYATENYVAVNGTPLVSNITQYGLDALKALTDYVKRHQLVGARALDRFYARFGKSLDSAKMDRSYYIGSDNIPLQIGDVMAHSDTYDKTSGSGAQLGDYAGKGIGFGANGNFEFSTDEYGMIIIVTSVVPQIGYYQGVDRTVLHKGRLDFWTPEFDQMGNQAIVKKELYLPMNVYAETDNTSQANVYLNGDLNTGIFGYTPRYAEYKIGRDRLTGDYRYASLNKAGDTSNAWHLMRNIGDFSSDSTHLVHGVDFVKGYDYAQYNRIFNNDEDNADKFYMIHTFNVESQAPMNSLYDTYKFGNEDDGAKKVLGDVNGVKVN